MAGPVRQIGRGLTFVPADPDKAGTPSWAAPPLIAGRGLIPVSESEPVGLNGEGIWKTGLTVAYRDGNPRPDPVSHNSPAATGRQSEAGRSLPASRAVPVSRNPPASRAGRQLAANRAVPVSRNLLQHNPTFRSTFCRFPDCPPAEDSRQSAGRGSAPGQTIRASVPHGHSPRGQDGRQSVGHPGT